MGLKDRKFFPMEPISVTKIQGCTNTRQFHHKRFQLRRNGCGLVSRRSGRYQCGQRLHFGLGSLFV